MSRDQAIRRALVQTGATGVLHVAVEEPKGRHKPSYHVLKETQFYRWRQWGYVPGWSVIWPE